MCEELSRFNPIKSLSVDLCMDYSAATHELGSGRCLPPRLLDSTQHPAGLLSLSRSQQASRAAEPEEPVPTEPAVSPSGTTVCRARLGACRLHPGSDQPGLRIWSTVVCPPGGSPGTTAPAGGQSIICCGIGHRSFHILRFRGCQLAESQAASALWHCSTECGATSAAGWGTICQCAQNHGANLLWNTADPEALVQQS